MHSRLNTLSLAIGLAAVLSLGMPFHMVVQAQKAARKVSPVPEKLLAEATIQAVSGGLFKYAFLQVQLQGRPVSLILDLGSPSALLLTAWGEANWVGDIPDVLDSLAFGTHMERNIEVHAAGFSKEVPAGMPPLAGLLGSDVLSHYDLLFDGPNRKVQLYLPAENGGDSDDRRLKWLPGGLTPADCIPMTMNPGRITFPAQANGKPVIMFFDSGSNRNTMSLSTAQVFGIDTMSPTVHLLPDGIPGAYPLAPDMSSRVWEAQGVTLTVAGHTLMDTPFSLRVQDRPIETDDPVVTLGLDAIRANLMFLSFNTKQVCLGMPH